jgi:hypothetical protein
MEKGKEQFAVGTIVFAEEVASPEKKYGVVVDRAFWRESMEKENPSMLINFNKSCESERLDIVTPIMLLTSTMGIGMTNNYTDVEKYIQNFIWTKSCYLTGFDNPEEFIAVMKQMTTFVGGPTLQYVHLVMSSADEIRRYFNEPNYLTKLCVLYDKAFPGMKGSQAR